MAGPSVYPRELTLAIATSLPLPDRGLTLGSACGRHGGRSGAWGKGRPLGTSLNPCASGCGSGSHRVSSVVVGPAQAPVSWPQSSRAALPEFLSPLRGWPVTWSPHLLRVLAQSQGCFLLSLIPRSLPFPLVFQLFQHPPKSSSLEIPSLNSWQALSLSDWPLADPLCLKPGSVKHKKFTFG